MYTKNSRDEKDARVHGVPPSVLLTQRYLHEHNLAGSHALRHAGGELCLVARAPDGDAAAVPLFVPKALLDRSMLQGIHSFYMRVRSWRTVMKRKLECLFIFSFKLTERKTRSPDERCQTSPNSSMLVKQSLTIYQRIMETSLGKHLLLKKTLLRIQAKTILQNAAASR